MTQAQLRVVVLGGSLGGLSAAAILRDAMYDVRVYERSHTALAGQGAGIVLNPATVRYLTERRAFDIGTISIATRWLRYLDQAGRTAHEQEHIYRFSSYNALYRSLLGCFDAGRYHLGTAVVGFEQDDRSVTVALADGRRTRCDLLVCADGIRSLARRLLLPDHAPAYAGYVAWRGTLAAEHMRPATFATLRPAIIYHVMPHSHLLTYPIPVIDQRSGAVQEHINWVWYRNLPLGAAFDDLMTDCDGTLRDLSVPAGAVQPRHIAQLRDHAAGLPLPLAELVGATERPFIQAIFDLEVPQMAFGRICLIGDAAWIARPHVAAGTAKAAADAWTLGAAMRASDGDVVAALRSWEPAQLQLGRAVVARTRAAGQRAQFEADWRVGDPLPFGLYAEGDSTMATIEARGW